MIQAPQVQYIPTQVPVQQYNPQANINTAVAPYQVPNQIYNYPTTSCYCQGQTAGKSQYNGVNIEIINPQGQSGAPNTGYAMPATYVPNSAIVPIQPYVLPAAYPAQTQVAQTPVAPAVPQPTVEPATIYETPVAQQPVAQQPAAQTPAVPAPQVATEPVVTPTVEEPVATIDPNFSPETFAGRLMTEDVDAQRAALEEIGQTLRSDNQLGQMLLDSQIVDALTTIINKDNSALAGPTPEVLELRKKPEAELTPEETQLAYSVSPLEAAELNKQYALYTIAFMQDRLNQEVTKRNEPVIELKELPSIETIIETAKSNPNDEVRISALTALSHIARPEYKADLTTIFELAKADQSPAVQEAATRALEDLSKIPAPAVPVQEAQAPEQAQVPQA